MRSFRPARWRGRGRTPPWRGSGRSWSTWGCRSPSPLEPLGMLGTGGEFDPYRDLVPREALCAVLAHPAPEVRDRLGSLQHDPGRDDLSDEWMGLAEHGRVLHIFHGEDHLLHLG